MPLLALASTFKSDPVPASLKKQTGGSTALIQARRYVRSHVGVRLGWVATGDRLASRFELRHHGRPDSREAPQRSFGENAYPELGILWLYVAQHLYARSYSAAPSESAGGQVDTFTGWAAAAGQRLASNKKTVRPTK